MTAFVKAVVKRHENDAVQFPTLNEDDPVTWRLNMEGNADGQKVLNTSVPVYWYFCKRFDSMRAGDRRWTSIACRPTAQRAVERAIAAACASKSIAMAQRWTCFSPAESLRQHPRLLLAIHHRREHRRRSSSAPVPWIGRAHLRPRHPRAGCGEHDVRRREFDFARSSKPPTSRRKRSYRRSAAQSCGRST